MTTEGFYSRETAIYVSTKTKLNSEQTKSVTEKLLHLMGYQSSNLDFNFHFIEEGALIVANASVDNEMKVSVRN